MMTILFIFDAPFYPQRGGIERVTENLVKSLIKRGYNIIYSFVMTDDETAHSYNYPCKYYPFPSKDLGSIENIEFLKKLVIDNSVDIVINQVTYNNNLELFLSTYGVGNSKLISVVHNSPKLQYDYIYSLTNSSVKEKFSRAARVVRGLIRGDRKRFWQGLNRRYSLLLEKSDVVCLLSDSFKPIFNEFVPGIDDSKVVAITNPMPFAKSEIKMGEKKKQIIFVGRLCPVAKRPDRVLKAWERIYKNHPDWELIFVGDGQDRASLERYAKRVDRVKFVGFQNPESYFQDASIICLTSNYEGFGMVLIEAMAYETVPVAFNSYASITDIITDGENGILVEPFNIKEFAKKLDWLMSNDPIREEMGRAGAKSIDKFDIEPITDRWERLFDKIKK